jgi:hypothetical protein
MVSFHPLDVEDTGAVLLWFFGIFPLFFITSIFLKYLVLDLLSIYFKLFTKQKAKGWHFSKIEKGRFTLTGEVHSVP